MKVTAKRLNLDQRLKKFLDFLFSPLLTLILIGGGAVYYLLMIVLTGRETATITMEIALWQGSGGDIPTLVYESFWFKLFFLLLFLNLLGRAVRTYQKKEKKVRKKEFLSAENIISFPNHQVFSFKSKPSELGKKISRLLKKSGYRVFLKEEDNWQAKAVKNTFQIKLGLLLKISLLLLLTSLIFSFAFREGGQLFLGEGEALYGRRASLQWSNYTWTPVREKGNLYFPFDYLGVIRIDPALKEDYRPKESWLVFKYPVKAEVEAGLDNQPYRLTLSLYPPTFFKGYFLFLSRFGYGPLILVRNKEGKEVYRRYHKAEIFPLGSEDVLSLPLFEERLALSLERPEKSKGVLLSPRRPVYRLKIIKGRKLILNRVLYPGELVSFKGYYLSIPETLFWVGIVILKDWGFYLFFLSLFLFLVSALGSLVVRFFFPYHEVYVCLEKLRGQDYLFVQVKPSFLHRLGRKIFQEIAKLVE